MKRVHGELLIAILLLGGCAAETNPAEDIAAAEAQVGAFFAAVEQWDMAALRATVTPDFELVEDTVQMSIDDFIAFMTPMHEQGAQGKWQLSDFRTEVDGNVAWTRFHNHGVLTMPQGATRFHWIEAVVLLRQPDGGWKLDRYHSTPVSIEGPLAQPAPAS